MRFDPERLHRRSIRLKGYDYSRPGAYFITICTQDQACLFGEVVDGGMRLNDAGQMVQDVWDELPAIYPGVQTDAFIVMPNHIHGIIILVGADPYVCPDEIGQPQIVAPRLSLSDVVHRFKTMTTKRYIDGVKKFGWTPFRRRLWQHNYYEHIIRNGHALQRIREYIWTNPLRWHLNRETQTAPDLDEFDRSL